MRNCGCQPWEIGGLSDHRWVNADAADRYDQGRNIQPFIDVVFKRNFLVEGQIGPEGNVYGLFDVITRRNDQCIRHRSGMKQDGWNGLSQGGKAKTCRHFTDLFLKDCFGNGSQRGLFPGETGDLRSEKRGCAAFILDGRIRIDAVERVLGIIDLLGQLKVIRDGNATLLPA